MSNRSEREVKGKMETFSSTRPNDMGPYAMPVLNDIANIYGDGTWNVYTIPMPSTKQEIKHLLEQVEASAQYAYADTEGQQVVIVEIGGGTGWLSLLTDAKVSLTNKDKLLKRIGTMNRPFSLFCFLEDAKVAQVQPLQFCNNATTKVANRCTPDEQNRLLDGAIAIRRSIWQEMVDNFKWDNNPLIAQMQANRLDNTKLFNFRAIGPWGYIKGNAAPIDDEVCDRQHGGADIVILDGEIKQAIIHMDGTYFMAEPQLWKSEVSMDTQTQVNLPGIYSTDNVRAWIDDWFDHQSQALRDGKILQPYAETLKWTEVLIRDGDFKASVETTNRFAAAEVVASGSDIREWPSLLAANAVATSRRIFSNRDEKKRVHVPIACCVYRQVISNSAARMWGSTIVVKKGEIRSCAMLGAHVVNDIDYIDNYQNWGGCDHDDFFHLFQLEVDGNKKVLAVRSPNGFGEYAIFDFHEKDPVFKWEKANGDTMVFPAVNAKDLPIQLSEAVKTGKVVYQGLPSQVNKASANRDSRYSPHYLARQLLENIDDSTGGAGGFVNTAMLYTMVTGEYHPSPICSMEDAIDVFAQGGSFEDKQAINKWVKDTIMAVYYLLVDPDNDFTVDREFWDSRGFAVSIKKITDSYPNMPRTSFKRRSFTDGIKRAELRVHGFSGAPHTCDGCKLCKFLKTTGELDKDVENFWGEAAIVGQEFARNRKKILGRIEPVSADSEGEFFLQADKLPLGRWGDTAGYNGVQAEGAMGAVRNWRSTLARFTSNNAQQHRLAIQAAEEAGRFQEAKNLRKSTPTISDEQWAVLQGDIMARIKGYSPNLYEQERFVLALFATCYMVPVKTSGMYQEQPVSNKAVFPILMKAMRRYGLAHEVVDFESDTLMDKDQPLQLHCKECGASAEKNNALTKFNFLMRGSLCMTCAGLGEWKRQCVSCGKKSTIKKVENLSLFESRDRHCKDCFDTEA